MLFRSFHAAFEGVYRFGLSTEKGHGDTTVADLHRHAAVESIEAFVELGLQAPAPDGLIEGVVLGECLRHGLEVYAAVDEFLHAIHPLSDEGAPLEGEADFDTFTGEAGPLGGVKEIQTRAYHQPLYALGTSSETWFDQSGQQAALFATLATTARPQTWRDRVTVWHKTIEGSLDQGELIKETSGPHSCPPGEKAVPVQLTETGHVLDVGSYHVLQKRGSALVLGSLGAAWLDKQIRQLKLSIGFNTILHRPDESVVKARWHFLRFGEVYVGVRATGMVLGKRKPVRCVTKNRYLRIEVPLVTGRPVKVTQEFREWCDFGYVFEIASKIGRAHV